MRPLTSKQYTGNQILNPTRRYVPAAATDLRETFARIRAEQQAQPSRNVRRIK